MKKYLTFGTICISILFSLNNCTKYDDSELRKSISNLEGRVKNVEDQYSEINKDIRSLQTIVSTLQSNDHITSIVPLLDKGETIGYVFTFAHHDAVTIYNTTPSGNPFSVGAKLDTDGFYYWTIGDEWMLTDAGNKIPVPASGENGKDGITPLLKVVDDVWYISYDKGISYKKLYDAPETSKCVFKTVTYDDENVYFVLQNDEMIVIPLGDDDEEIESLFTTWEYTVTREDWKVYQENGKNQLYVEFDNEDITEEIMEYGAVVGYACITNTNTTKVTLWTVMPYIFPFSKLVNGNWVTIGENVRFEYSFGKITFVIEDLDGTQTTEISENEVFHFKIVVMRDL